MPSPVNFYFRAFDADSGALLGGGHYDAFIESEAAYVAAEKHFSEVFPGVEVHIEEMTEEEYRKEAGQ